MHHLKLASLQRLLQANKYGLIDNRAIRHLPASYVARGLFNYVIASGRHLLIASVLLLHGFHTLGIHVEPVDLRVFGPALLRVELNHAETQELRKYEADRSRIILGLPKEVEIKFDLVCVFDPIKYECEFPTLWGRSQ